MKVYVSPSIVLPAFRSLPTDSLVLEEKNFAVGNYSDTREIDTTIKIPKEAQQNGTLWAHFYVGLSGQQLDPAAKDITQTMPSTSSVPSTSIFRRRRSRSSRTFSLARMSPRKRSRITPPACSWHHIIIQTLPCLLFLILGISSIVTSTLPFASTYSWKQVMPEMSVVRMGGIIPLCS